MSTGSSQNRRLGRWLGLFALGIAFAMGIAITGFGGSLVAETVAAPGTDTPAMMGAAILGFVGLLAVAVGVVTAILSAVGAFALRRRAVPPEPREYRPPPLGYSSPYRFAVRNHR